MSRYFEVLQVRDPEALESSTIPADVGTPVPSTRYPRAQQSDEGSDWLRVVAVLKKHWKVSAAFAVMVVATVTLVTFLMRPVYEPVARVEVDPPGAEVFSLQGNSSSGDDAMQYLETMSKNMQSDQLALNVVRALGLQSNPEFMRGEKEQTGANPENTAMGILRRSTTVNRDTSSRLILVSVGTHDAQLSATVTNTLVNLFISRDYQMRHEAVMQSSQWLQRQLDDIRQRMEDSNHTLASFQKSSGIAAIGDQQNTFSEEMTELSRQLMQAQADRIQLQSYLNKFTGEASASLPQINNSPVVQGLTQKLAEARAELAETLAVYGTNHPNSKRLQNQVDELQGQLNAQRSAILSDLKTTYSAAQAREQLMESQVKGMGRHLELLARYNALKKEADANTELYNTLFQKIKEAGIAAESKSSNIRVVDPARVLDSPTRPNRMINIALAIVAGILGGVILAFLREALDTRIRTPEDIKKCLGTGSVSIVPAIENNGSLKRFGKAPTQYAQVFLLNRPNSPEAEALRGLYTSVRLSRQVGALQTLLVVSPHSGEGKTTLTVNLGVALAQHGRTCIVDADMRKPGVAPALGVQANLGLSDVLAGALPLEQVLVPAENMPNLAILPAGGAQADPGALISSSAMEDLVRQLRDQYEFVIIDSAPILPFADGRALSALVDGVVLVGRAGVTTRATLVRAMELLQGLRSAPVVEIVLNAAEYPTTDYRYYYRNYGYGKTA